MAQGRKSDKKRLSKGLGGVVLGLGVFIDNNASFFVNKSPRKSSLVS